LQFYSGKIRKGMMEKKWWIASLVGLMALGGVILILHQFIRLPGFSAGPMEALPPQAMLVWEGKARPQDLDSLFHTNHPDALTKENLNQWSAFLENFLPSDSLPPVQIGATRLVASFLQDQGWLIILDDPTQAWDLDSWAPEPTSDPTLFRGYTLTHQVGWSRARFRNLWLIGQQAFLVEDAIRMLADYRNPTWQASPFAQRDPRQIPNWWLRPADSKNWWQWPAVDTSFRSGSWHRRVAEDTYLQLAARKPWALDTIPNLLPTTTEAFWIQTFSGVQEFGSTYPKLAVATRWLSGMQGPACTVWLPNPLTQKRSLPVWMIQHEDPEGLIERIAEDYGEMASRSYQLFTLHQIAFDPGLPNPISGRVLPMENPWMLALEGFILIADRPEQLESWVDQYMVGDVLGQQTPYLELQNGLPLEARGWAYGSKTSNLPFPGIHSGRGATLAAIDPKGKKGTVLTCSSDQDFGALSLQVAWREVLDAPIVTSPQWVEDNGRYLLLVQDGNDQLYCFGPLGDFRWKRQLDGRLLGRWQSMDYYQNGSRQWIANTNQSIYVLDPQGNLVGTYPLRLQSPMTNPLTLVNFDGRGDYAYFVACANEQLYGFDRFGKPLDGWAPLPDVGRVIQPLRHFQFDQGDYLYVYSQRENIQVFNREGKPRLEPVPVSGTILSPPDHQVHPLSTRMVVGTQSGRLQVINPQGQTFGLQTQVGKGNWASFRMVDWASDDRKDYLIGNGKEVALFAYEGNDFKEQWRRELPFEVDAFCTLTGASDWLGVVGLEAQQVALLNRDGKLANGSPLPGTTALDLIPRDKAGEALLAVGLNDQVYVYVVNLKPLSR
jgi:hypothetical protein